jgi:hypothetical protein
VVAAGREAGDACLPPVPVEQNQPGNVERDQRGRGWSAHPIDAEAAQHEGCSGGEEARATIQSRRHGETSTEYAWFGRTASYLVVTSLGFRTDGSLYRASSVISEGRHLSPPIEEAYLEVPIDGFHIKQNCVSPIILPDNVSGEVDIP